ncbi:uncharacterized protein LOC113665556 [Pocillopora damicornis]|uniref:uncharacterized protein LOC113665556 n=1 Tax=Pocillopora damicornis TaxID=46731 RepID=UPI000F54F497|nr:uncharacterized protein LOC113665556 [Pocillopora damicornis]
MMISISHLRRTIALSLLIFFISETTGYPSGIEIINASFCVVDVLEAIVQYELVSDGKVIVRDRDDGVCISSPDLCSLPAGETKVWVRSEKFPSIPPFFKNRTYKGRVQLFNKNNIMFLCGEVVGKVR